MGLPKASSLSLCGKSGDDPKISMTMITLTGRWSKEKKQLLSLCARKRGPRKLSRVRLGKIRISPLFPETSCVQTSPLIPTVFLSGSQVPCILQTRVVASSQLLESSLPSSQYLVGGKELQVIPDALNPYFKTFPLLNLRDFNSSNRSIILPIFFQGKHQPLLL